MENGVEDEVRRIALKYNKKEALIASMFEVCEDLEYDFKESKKHVTEFLQRK